MEDANEIETEAAQPTEALEEAQAIESEGLSEADLDDFADDAEGEVLEDIEHEGKTYQVPKALKGAFLRQADYTRKTQELAAERRAVEAERVRHDETAQHRAALVALEQEMAACRGVDWGALWAQNPAGAQDLAARMEDLAAAHQEVSQDLETWSHQREEAEAYERAARLERGHAELARDLPGWSPALAERLSQFAIDEYGVTPDELSEVEDPRLVKLLHAAYAAANARGESRGARRHLEAQFTRPAYTVAGRGGQGKNPSRMNTDEWMRHRNAQLRRDR